MHIYTHLVLAHALLPHLKPSDSPAYYLGAIIPDIRYLAGARRAQTHLTAIQLLAYRQRYPHLESFLLGYLIHCEMDLIDLSRVLFEHTPLRLLNSLRQLQLAGVLLESHFLEHSHIHLNLADDSNEMLANLGIQPEQVCAFAHGVSRFLENPSFQAELVALQAATILQSRRMRAYLRLVTFFENSHWLRHVLFGRLPVARVAAQLPAILLGSPLIKRLVRR
ncbi:MAG TPA: hypothetical protein VLH85_00720 [Levilinea sp.]|nr:hypothetical protein [Levilinea sp.]